VKRLLRACVPAALGLALAAPSPAPSRKEPGAMDRIAERYVKLVLALGVHDGDYVDAYYGPREWRDAAAKEKRSAADVGAEARALVAELERTPPPGDALLALRHAYLSRQLASLAARVDLLSGRRLSFDQESQALYDATAPVHEEAEFQAALADLSRALPGQGPLAERYEAFRRGFVVPRDKLDAVFRAAIAECRRRSLARVELPPEESFSVEYVTDKPWGGYNWYQGGYRSVIQVNTDLPIAIDRAVDLACHEGYPGHHAYNVLLERRLVKERGFVEFTVYPLFSPQSLIAEGTANYGIEVAFPGDERAAYEKRALFPLAGLDPAGAEAYYAVQRLLDKLSYAGNEAARRYLEGRLDAEGARRWIETYALASPPRARQRLEFIERYRSYVINYNLGRDLVRAYIEARGGTPDHPRRRWAEFERLLASPRLPGGLR
jgi:hypothetical protein